MMALLITFIFCIVANHCAQSKEFTSVVQTDKGPVQGEIFETVRRSTPFSSFRGIPYGKAPIGYSRFKAPEEVESWTEIFDATVEATPCPQPNPTLNPTFSEDCLNINVYTPRINFSSTNENLFPVMVWIYGGSFKTGDTAMINYGPDFLIESGVIVVGINYRLGILGYLALNLPGATGNAALKDQQLGLKWVQRNIRQFGGDPNSVTLFGVSSGSASIDYHSLAEGSQGLFHRYISMSGSALSPWAFSSAFQAEKRAFLLGRLLGINATNKEQLLQELYQQPAYDLVMATQEITKVDPPFKPTYEDPKIAGDSIFISECSVNKYKSGIFSNIPSINGYMADEAIVFFIDLDAAKEATDMSIDHVQRLSGENALTHKLRSHRMELDLATSVNDIANDTLQDLLTIITDVLYVTEIDIKQRFLSKFGTAPVYYYRNSFAPYPSVHRFVRDIDMIGAAHGDDTALYWYMPTLDFPTDPDDPFVIVRDRTVRMWTNFAKFSDPTPFGENDSLLQISWPDSGLKGIHLEIDYEFTVGNRPIDRITKTLQNISKSTLGKVNGC